MSIIPQDSVLFSGSIRLNLDPFGTHTDAELWAALAKANLAELVEGFPGRLDEPVTENGENLSAGENRRRALNCACDVLMNGFTVT
jgi:ABC-type multidrug transport system fused ATPase/permease subunit